MVVADFSLWGDVLQEYITILENSTAEYSEKHSRFIAIVQHCESEAQAAELILGIKSKYWDARHNVYAYVLQNGTVRFSDDGEPHGTAAKPILDVIQGSGVTDVLITVTRYFGGTLLGTGGLVRAYSTSARDALNLAQRVQMCPCLELEVCCDYSDYEPLSKLISRCGGMPQDTDFTEKVKIDFIIKESAHDDFIHKLTETFFGKIKAKVQKELFFPIKL